MFGEDILLGAGDDRVWLKSESYGDDLYTGSGSDWVYVAQNSVVEEIYMADNDNDNIEDENTAIVAGIISVQKKMEH